MEVGELIKVGAENGITVALLVFFVWWTTKTSAAREERLGGRIDSLDSRLLNIVEDTTRQLERSNIAIENNTKALTAWTEAINKKNLNEKPQL